MKIYEIGTGYTSIPAQVPAATESVVEELTKAFIDIGQEVEIIDIYTNNRGHTDLPITEVKIPQFLTRSDVSLGIVHKVKRVTYSIALAFKLKKMLKKSNEKFVLHFHNQYNMFFFTKLVNKKLRAKAVCVYTNHNGMWSLPLEESEEILKGRYFQEIAAMKEADINFVLNDKMKENVIKYLNLPQEKVVKINNGVNTDIYRPLAVEKIEEIKEKCGLAGKLVVLQVGSVNENKGQGRSLQMLLPLINSNKDIVFAYAGGIVSQEYKNEVDKLAESRGVEDRVKYLGSVSPGEKMNEIYNIADAMIFSSKYEGAPLVCIEALSAGVPIVLPEKYFLDFGKGCIKLYVENFSEKFSQVITDKTKLKEYKNDARKNAIENYTWESIAKDYIKNINAL